MSNERQPSPGGNGRQATGNESATKQPRQKKPYDLEERTTKFGEAIIAFAKRIPVTPVTRRMIEQLADAGTSVGANYREANDAESKKDFRHKIATCKKESNETKFWLQMVAAAVPDLAGDARVLWLEAKELHLIFGSIRRNTSVGR